MAFAVVKFSNHVGLKFFSPELTVGAYDDSFFALCHPAPIEKLMKIQKDDLRTLVMEIGDSDYSIY